MMINKLRIQESTPMTRGGVTWALPICDLNIDSSAGENGYLIRDVVGIDPPDLNAIIVGFDTNGNPVYGNYSEGREVSIRIELVPVGSQTVSELRDALYKFVSRGLTLSFMYDSVVKATWSCAIKTIEAVHFSNKPEVKLILSSKYATFSGPSLIQIPPATLATANPIINYTEGTTPADLAFVFLASGSSSSFRIYNHAQEWHDGTYSLATNFEVTKAFVSGDYVSITSTPETQTVFLTHLGANSDLEGYLNAFAVWPKLIPGVNAFDWTFNVGWSVFNAYYRPRFWGV